MKDIPIIRRRLAIHTPPIAFEIVLWYNGIRVKKSITTNNMKTFKVQFHYTGGGEAKIKANNKEEAIEMFYNRDVVNEKRYGEDYSVEVIEVSKSKVK